MTIHHSTETAPPDATKRSPCDLNDWEFGLVAPHGAQKAGSGKQRIVDIRDVLHAIFSGTRIGCQWRMLPSDAAYRARAWRCIRACPCVVGQRASRGRQYRAPVARHSCCLHARSCGAGRRSRHRLCSVSRSARSGALPVVRLRRCSRVADLAEFRPSRRWRDGSLGRQI